jgi:hypothetical protein
LTSADLGDFLPQDLRASATPEIQERAGRLSLDIPANNSSTASGDGSLVVLHFRALSSRPATMIAVQQFAAQGSDELAIPAIAPRPFVVKIAQ